MSLLPLVVPPNKLIKKLIDVVDINCSRNCDAQWDAYSDFSWRFALYLLSKLPLENSLKLRRNVKATKDYTEVMRCITSEEIITNEIDALFHNFTHSISRSVPKNSEAANQQMNEAKILMKDNNFMSAAKSFSKAIENHPFKSTEFGECIKNRGVCLYQCKFYEYALKDFNEAIEILKENKEEFIELMFMKSECLRQLKRNTESNDCWNIAKNELSEATFMDENFKSELLESFQALRALDVSEINDSEVEIPTYEDHCIFGAPKYLEIVHDELKGRLVKTNVDIPKGTIVMSEPATVTWLAPCKYSHCCNFCFKQLVCRFVPCRICTAVRYCSLSCEQKAWQKYHSVECRFLNLLKYCSFCHMSMRVVFTFGFDSVLEAIDESKRLKGIKDCTLRYSYKSFYSLVENMEHLNAEQLFAFSVGCLVATRIAELMNLIQRDSPHYCTFAGILLRHILQANLNCFAVVDINIRSLKLFEGYSIYVDKGNLSKIGIAVFFGTGMAAHSCDYNCDKHSVGGKLLFVANRDIKAGDEITITYCPHYKKMCYKDRQKYLKDHYYFDCQCNACRNHWENVQYAYRCTHCSGAVVWSKDYTNYCMKCGNQNIDLMDFMAVAEIADDKVKTAKYLLDRNDTTDVKLYLKDAIDIMKETYYSITPQETAVFQLCRYYQMKKQYDKAFKYCMQLTQITRERLEDDCLEGVSITIRSVHFLVTEIEQLSFLKRRVTLKVHKARQLLSSSIYALKVSQNQQLPLIGKVFANNFCLLPKLTSKLSVASIQ